MAMMSAVLPNTCMASDDGCGKVEKALQEICKRRQCKMTLRARVWPFGVVTMLTMSPLHVSAQIHSPQAALSEAFANLDRVMGDHEHDPVSSGWSSKGGLMMLGPRSGSQIQLAVWAEQGSLRGAYGLAEAHPDAPCDNAGRNDRYKVAGTWLSFKAACVEGMRVLSPRSPSAKKAMYAAMRQGKSLTIESPQGWKAEFDLEGLPVADAVIRLKAADAAMPERRSATSPAVASGSVAVCTSLPTNASLIKAQGAYKIVFTVANPSDAAVDLMAFYFESNALRFSAVEKDTNRSLRTLVPLVSPGVAPVRIRAGDKFVFSFDLVSIFPDLQSALMRSAVAVSWRLKLDPIPGCFSEEVETTVTIPRNAPLP
jgi:hypothetical protein